MIEAYICDAIRTPFGRYGGVLSSIRTDDLAAAPIKALMERNPEVDWRAVDDVIFGCANQAGEDNRNVARMALLLAGLPQEVPGVTVNRLCGSSMEAVVQAARAIHTGEADLVVAGGVESMSRSPFVMGKSAAAFSRAATLEDTTLGWRFINPLMKERYGADSMAETGENVAEEFHISREDQDAFAYRSQHRAAAAIASGAMAQEIRPVAVPQRKGAASLVVDRDEHPRSDTTLEGLAALKPIVRATGTITAGNAAGINDGACALFVASESAVKRYELTPRARVMASAVAGVAPRVMGIGPVPASRKALQRRAFGWRPGCHRTERGFRFPGACGAAGTWRPGRFSQGQPKRRRHRYWPSSGSQRRKTCHYSVVPVDADAGPTRAVHHVHWSRARHRRRAGAGVKPTVVTPGPAKPASRGRKLGLPRAITAVSDGGHRTGANARLSSFAPSRRLQMVV